MHLYISSIPSGNCYKVELILAHLNISYESTTLNILASPSEARKPEFLALNPNGKVPILILDNGTVLTESNAILFYLSEGTKYLPEDRLARAQVLQWLFWEQYSHEPYVAVWKFRTYWAPHGFDDLPVSEVQKMKEKGQAAIDLLEKHLESGKEWLVGASYSIADISLYAYTNAAESVGFRVEKNVSAWLKRVEQQDGWIRIMRDPTGKCPL